MGDAVITRRASAPSGSAQNQLLVFLWGLRRKSSTSTYYYPKDWNNVFMSYESDYFSYDSTTGSFTALQDVDANIWIIARGSYNASNSSKTMTYRLYKNSSILSTDTITGTGEDLITTAVSTTLTVGDTITMSSVSNASSTLAMENGFFIELQ